MSLIPSAGYNEILNVLMTWGRSGLIPNTKVIKSYSPPVVDSLTGVPVLMPATVWSTGIIPDYSKAASIDINDFSSAPRAGSRVQDFNPPIGKLVDPQMNVPPKTEVALDTVEYGPLYKESALTATTPSQYEKDVSKLKIPTIADRMTRDLVHKPVLIMEDYQDAKTMVAVKTDVPDNTKIAPQIPNRYEMVTTGVPCAIPGVLNCYVETYDKIDTRAIEYRYSLPMTTMTWRPDAEEMRAFGFDPNYTYVLPTGDFDFSAPLDEYE